MHPFKFGLTSPPLAEALHAKEAGSRMLGGDAPQWATTAKFQFSMEADLCLRLEPFRGGGGMEEDAALAPPEARLRETMHCVCSYFSLAKFLSIDSLSSLRRGNLFSPHNLLSSSNKSSVLFFGRKDQQKEKHN